MAVNKCDYYEAFPASGAYKYGRVEDIEVDKQGVVHAPQKPGLGFEIGWELVKRNRVAVLNLTLAARTAASNCRARPLTDALGVN